MRGICVQFRLRHKLFLNPPAPRSEPRTPHSRLGGSMADEFRYIDLRVPSRRFANWEEFLAAAPEYSIGLEVIDDVPGRRQNRVHFDHHAGVVREATMSAAMQAYIAVRQGRLMGRWLPRRSPLPVYEIGRAACRERVKIS